MKERVTLTLDKDLLRMIDGSVDKASIKNRSHAIELLLRQSVRLKQPRTAVILAGGKTGDTKPRALLEVGGRRVMDYNLDLLKRHGIKNVIVSVGEKGEDIMNAYGDGKAHGVHIEYVQEDEPLGTAGPLRMIKDRVNEAILVMNGDELKDINLTKMFQSHVAMNAQATLALTTVADPAKYGVVLLDGSRVTHFVEKPQDGVTPSKLINAGAYVLEPEVLKLIPEGFAMMERDVFPKLAREGVMHGYPFSGQWFDVSHERAEQIGENWQGFTQ
jgi:NDP-sugar pyrophosphorylase family protein